MSDDRNVITALANVQADIGGIGKTKPKDGQLNYAYRGIDAIASEAQPLFGREGVVIVPTEATINGVDDITVGGKPWTDTRVTVAWTIYGPGGVTDQITAITQGLGRDNSDKGINKAMTGAYKNLLLRVLCIGDPQDDADQPHGQNNWTDYAPAPAPPPPDDPPTAEAKALIDRVRGLDPDRRAAYVLWRDIIGETRKVLLAQLAADEEWRAVLGEALDRIEAPADDDGIAGDDDMDPRP